MAIAPPFCGRGGARERADGGILGRRQKNSPEQSGLCCGRMGKGKWCFDIKELLEERYPQKGGSAAEAWGGRLQPSSRSKRAFLRKRRSKGAGGWRIFGPQAKKFAGAKRPLLRRGGGDGGNRNRVRKSIRATFYERSRFIGDSPPEAPSGRLSRTVAPHS